jgi:hypothetical protein
MKVNSWDQGESKWICYSLLWLWDGQQEQKRGEMFCLGEVRKSVEKWHFDGWMRDSSLGMELGKIGEKECQSGIFSQHILPFSGFQLAALVLSWHSDAPQHQSRCCPPLSSTERRGGGLNAYCEVKQAGLMRLPTIISVDDILEKVTLWRQHSNCPGQGGQRGAFESNESVLCDTTVLDMSLFCCPNPQSVDR